MRNELANIGMQVFKAKYSKGEFFGLISITFEFSCQFDMQFSLKLASQFVKFG